MLDDKQWILIIAPSVARIAQQQQTTWLFKLKMEYEQAVNLAILTASGKNVVVVCGCSSAVEHLVANENVESSILFTRSKFNV